MTTVSPEERISRIEGILEQINERQGTLERMLEERTSTIMGMLEERTSTIMQMFEERTSTITGMLERKADRVEVRLYLAVNVTLSAAILGLLGVLIAKL
jgi:C4-type Zn-finger protein